MSQLSNELNDIIGLIPNDDTKNERKKLLDEIAKNQKIKTNLIKKAIGQQSVKNAANGISNSESSKSALKTIASDAAATIDEKIEDDKEKLKSIGKPQTTKNLLKLLLTKMESHFE
jgi:hypothetical protein